MSMRAKEGKSSQIRQISEIYHTSMTHQEGMKLNFRHTLNSQRYIKPRTSRTNSPHTAFTACSTPALSLTPPNELKTLSMSSKTRSCKLSKTEALRAKISFSLAISDGAGIAFTFVEETAGMGIHGVAGEGVPLVRGVHVLPEGDMKNVTE